MWLIWVAAAVASERRKARAPVVSAKEAELDDGSPPPYKQHKSRFAYAYYLCVSFSANYKTDD
jgi:hypothetical protein